MHYFSEDEYVEDTISLNGDDWTFSQHQVLEVKPCEDDFKNTVKEYLGWKVANILKGECND